MDFVLLLLELVAEVAAVGVVAKLVDVVFQDTSVDAV